MDDVELCNSEDELLMESEDDIQSVAPRGRVAGAVIGVVVLVACGAVALFGIALSSRARPETLTVRTLFESPEVHAVATENIMTIHRHLQAVERPQSVRQIVEKHFNIIGEEVARLNPEAAQVPITDEQKEATLHVLRYLSDGRVQNIGVKVAHAIRDAGSEDPDVLRRHIARTLSPRMADMTRLHDEMLPASMRELLDSKVDGFEHLFSPKMMRLWKTMDDSWDARLITGEKEAEARRLRLQTGTTGGWGAATAAPAPAPATGGPAGSGIGGDTEINGIDRAEEGLGIAAAAAEEVSVLLRIIKPLTKMFGKDINLPPQATSSIGAIDALLSIASCETKASEDKNPMEVGGCLMSAGSAGMDALREVFTLVGLLGDNNAANGEQGNHNGDSKEHLGLLTKVQSTMAS